MRRTGPWAALVALAVLVAFPATRAWAIPPESEPWFRAQTPHFILIGNTSAKGLREIGVRLERFRNVLEGEPSADATASALPTTIIVFKDEAAFAPYKMKSGGTPEAYLGVFQETRDGNYIGMSGDANRGPYDVIYHEYVHYFLSRRYGNVPLWLHEGLAEYYSTFVMHQDGDESDVEIGRPVANHVLYLRQRSLMPLVDLFAMDGESKDYHEGERQGVFYAQSWALVHYLLQGKPELKPKLQKFLDLQSGSMPVNQAFRSAFGFDYGALETQLGAYIVAGEFNYTSAKVAAADAPVTAKMEPLPRAEVLYALGDYLAHVTPWQSSRVEEHFRAALRADAGHARAWAGLAGVLAPQNKWVDAQAAYEKALALAPEDDLPPFLYGMTQLDRYIAAHGDVPAEPRALPAPVASARKQLVRSVELNPNRAEAFLGVGQTYLFDPDHVEVGIGVMEQARSRLPARMEIAYYLMMLYIRAGDRPSAEGLASEVLVHAQDPKLLEYARDMLEKDDSRQQRDVLTAAIDLLNAKDYDGGIAKLEGLVATGTDPLILRTARETLASAKEHRQQAHAADAYNRQVDQYNQALAKARAKDYAGARAVLERVLPTITDAELAGATRELLDRMKALQAQTPSAQH